MKQITSVILCLQALACMLIGCSKENTKNEGEKDEVPTTEIEIAIDSTVTPALGEVVVMRTMDQWCKFFTQQQSEELGLDFSKNSAIMICDQSETGIYSMTQKLKNTAATGYVLENKAVGDYTGKCIWKRVLKTPIIPQDAKVTSKTTYTPYDQTMAEGDVETSQITVTDDLSKIDPFQNPCVIRSAEELKRYMPQQSVDIDFDQNSLLLITGSSMREIQSVESKLSFAKGGKFTLSVAINIGNGMKTTTWSRLLKTPRLPMGASMDMVTQNSGNEIATIKLKSTLSAELLTNMEYFKLYVIRSKTELKNCYLEFENYTPDFEKNSILAIKGWSYQNVESITHTLSKVNNEQTFEINVNGREEGTIDPVWISVVAVPVIDKKTTVTSKVTQSYNPSQPEAKTVEFKELPFSGLREDYQLLSNAGVERNRLYVFRSLDQMTKCLPEKISADYKDTDFNKNSILFVYAYKNDDPNTQRNRKLSYIEGFGYVYRIDLKYYESPTGPSEWVDVLLIPKIDDNARAIIDFQTRQTI